MELKTIQLTLNELDIDTEDIYLGLGYGGITPEKQILEMMDEIFLKANEICQPRIAYQIFEGEVKDKTTISIENTVFKAGSIITAYLPDTTHFAVFVATAGQEFDQYLKQLRTDGFLAEEYIADAIGSEIVEACVRFIQRNVQNDVQLLGYHLSNSYSPGYCGWHLKEQQKLFSLFPKDICEISLNDSFLMTPIKSVSGIIGLGEKIKKLPYSCEICTMQNCYKRKEIIS